MDSKLKPYVPEVSIDDKENYRYQRVKIIKKAILILILCFIIIPFICCLYLMNKINNLEHKLEEIKTMKIQEKEYLLDDSIVGTSVVHAAETDSGVLSEAQSTTIQGNDVVAQDTEPFTQNQEDARFEENPVNDAAVPNNKNVYLTFDDGPSSISDGVLDILKEYNVHATFFVIGKESEDAKRIYKRIVDEGHTIGLHSYSHQYQYIYQSVSNFTKDIEKLIALIQDTTGVKPEYYRFPGGSSNTICQVSMSKLISVLNKHGITYYDWNVVNGDANGKILTEKQMINSVVGDVKDFNNSIVLMHDSSNKKLTLKTLPKIIQKLQTKGYALLPITDDVKPIQHFKKD